MESSSGLLEKPKAGARVAETQPPETAPLFEIGLESCRMAHARLPQSGSCNLALGDASNLYTLWESPVAIISDGPYGVRGFPGDPATVEELPSWYEPHIVAWSRYASPLTTLWFWNTELGWATVHPLLVKHGWSYRCCNIWNKGIAHIAGNANTQSLRKFPVVSEVCVQYVKDPVFQCRDGKQRKMKEWLRYEWMRAGLPLSDTNKACGVKNAATRKYFTQCHLWYYPPVEAFEKLAAHANAHGHPDGRPYFSLDGRGPLSPEEWEKMRAKFRCDLGVTNIWEEPAVRGTERVKARSKCLHANQKPLKLIERILRASTDPGDVVWEPFGGLCSVGVASIITGRKCFSAEINRVYYEAAVQRLSSVASHECS